MTSDVHAAPPEHVSGFNKLEILKCDTSENKSVICRTREATLRLLISVYARDGAVILKHLGTIFHKYLKVYMNIYILHLYCHSFDQGSEIA